MSFINHYKYVLNKGQIFIVVLISTWSRGGIRVFKLGGGGGEVASGGNVIFGGGAEIALK